jgi:hypothetical protein
MSNHVHLLLMTGMVPIASVMRRLLTVYAQDFNRRHNRHGQLFQNRYKSILCEQDLYLLELVRYIHLNPVRAGLVRDLGALEQYPYSGHAVIMGGKKHAWQNRDAVLQLFGTRAGAARVRYRAFLSDGVAQGRRPDLVGGGMIRSVGGWEELRKYRRMGVRIKGDERILGSSDFVAEVLQQAEEEITKRADMKKQGIAFKALLSKAATYYNIDVEELCSGSRQRLVAKARAAVCYLAVRKLQISCKDAALRLKISPSAVSNAVMKGRSVVKRDGNEVSLLNK